MQAMEFDIEALEAGQAYKLLASVVVPRPIALVSTLGAGGAVNAAPYSFFNMVGSSPPAVVLGIGSKEPGTPKDTRANIERTGEFVVNLVHYDLADAMNLCAIEFPAGESELRHAGLTASASVRIAAPRLAEARVSLECRLHSVVEVGDNKIVLGQVVFLHIDDEFVEGEKLHVKAEALELIGRMHGGGWYVKTTDMFDLPRPNYADWLAKEEK
jgi:flavin reductase (DIM6/NTAB) family NADH-FMN oxidoreductase RutF